VSYPTSHVKDRPGPRQNKPVGQAPDFNFADDSDFAANSRLVFNIEYDSVANANDAVLVTNPGRGVTYPNGTAEVSTLDVSILSITLTPLQHIKFQAIGHEPVNPNSPAAQMSAPPRTPSIGFQTGAEPQSHRPAEPAAAWLFCLVSHLMEGRNLLSKTAEAWNAPRTKKTPEAWNAPRTKKTPEAGAATSLKPAEGQ
jgi:hypothetical protein